MDENLTWKNHADAITKKISSGISALKRVRELIDNETMVAHRCNTQIQNQIQKHKTKFKDSNLVKFRKINRTISHFGSFWNKISFKWKTYCYFYLVISINKG